MGKIKLGLALGLLVWSGVVVGATSCPSGWFEVPESIYYLFEGPVKGLRVQGYETGEWIYCLRWNPYASG